MFVDPVLFPHVLINILDNAIKYSPPDTPIEITACAGPKDLVISVGDRGIGIPSEHLHRVFEKFHRLRQPASAAGVAGGSGLGLAIAKAIVEAHGGRVWAEQRARGGAIVRVSLPLERKIDD
jgi:two-component system, OmpR family, sensor histidine kinase KdpD